ncbi:hypothetical protein, partial [Desulfobulbus propionicus]
FENLLICYSSALELWGQLKALCNRWATYRQSQRTLTPPKGRGFTELNQQITARILARLSFFFLRQESPDAEEWREKWSFSWFVTRATKSAGAEKKVKKISP